MIKREVLLPEDIVAQIISIVDNENYEAQKDAFPKGQIPPVFLSQEEAEALITLAVTEKRRHG